MENVVLSSDQQTIFGPKRLQDWLKQEINNVDTLDLTKVASDLQLSLNDLQNICQNFILKEHRIILSNHWLLSKILTKIKEEGRLSYGTFCDQWNLTNLTHNYFNNLILQSNIRGFHSKDGEIFLSVDYVREKFRGATKLYVDISFTNVAKVLDIPISYVEEILTQVIEGGIIEGKISRTEQRVIIREIPTSIVEQLIGGQVVTTDQIKESYKQSLEKYLHTLRTQLPSSKYVLTRQETFIRISPIHFDCQICGTSAINELFLKCEQCGRDLCWDHFNELLSVGRSTCPQCDGNMVFLPLYCEKCHIDYVRVPKKIEFCDFCDYPLTVSSIIRDYYRRYKETRKRRFKPENQNSDTIKDSKPKKL